MSHNLQIINADCLTALRGMAPGSVHCCVTSPPYWGLRDYGVAGQLGLESAPEEYVARMVEVFREVWRVLRADGTLWMNLGDSYASNGQPHKHNAGAGLKPKDLVGIPWRVAFALQADGWYLRSDIIWHKINPMPESVTDRPTKAHEYVFLLTKAAHYFYDAEAIKEPCSESTHARISQDLAGQVGRHRVNGGGKTNGPMKAVISGSTRKLAEAGSGIAANRSFESALAMVVGSRNKRDVWPITSAQYSEAHFATFPPALVKPCILAGTSARGCCPKCGAPWERIVQDGAPLEDWKRACGADSKGEYHGQNTKDYQKHRAQPASTVKERILRGMVEKKTTGWQPTCDCQNSDTPPLVPCTVLDPFGGSGTTGQVALELGRRAVLIELNPQYIPLIENRTNVTPGLILT